MSEIQRRDFLTGTAAVAAARRSARGTKHRSGRSQLHEQCPRPAAVGQGVADFQVRPGEVERTKVIGKSTAKEATVEQFPISKGIAGVSMGLEPGAMRELHWHATAAEWAYVDRGRVRTTVIDPQGNSETNDFDPGDVWYFPRGHGHMLECLGDEPCHFVLIFDNGYFSEFGTFSVTDWIGHVPQAAAGEELRTARIDFRRFSPERGVLCPRDAAAQEGGRPPVVGSCR